MARFGPCHLMEDHREALFLWRQLDARGVTCVHVDAHLDTCELWLPNLLPQEQSAEINCGNYLLHALRENLVGHLYWVVPPHLAGGELTVAWGLEELQRWLYLRCADAAALEIREGRLEGSIEGHRLTICTSQTLPQNLGPVWLDLDVDYFLDGQDQIWQSPFQLAEDFQHLQSHCSTVAFSVDGGFTPLYRRFLGYLCQHIWSDEGQIAQQYWESLQGQRAIQEDDPSWLKAAHCVALGWGLGQDHQGPAWDRAARLDSRFTVDPNNLANQHWLRYNYSQCHLWLDRLEDGPVLHYLRGLAYHSEGRSAEAIECWQKLLCQPSLEQEHRAHLLFLSGLAYLRQNLAGEACPLLQQAVRLMPQLACLWRELGRAQRESGQLEEAAKSWRRAIKLEPERLASLEIRLLLAKVYSQLGQVSWLQQECRQLLLEPAAKGYLQIQAERLLIESQLRSRS